VHEAAAGVDEQDGRETFAGWATRWCDDRERRHKLASARDERSRLRYHVLPLLGRDAQAGDLPRPAATHATWVAVRGDEAAKIQRRLGHADLKATLIYVLEAEALRDSGVAIEPFPPLPPELCGQTPAEPVHRGRLNTARQPLAGFVSPPTPFGLHQR
jgi:hypothetical protein